MLATVSTEKCVYLVFLFQFRVNQWFSIFNQIAAALLKAFNR